MSPWQDDWPVACQPMDAGRATGVMALRGMPSVRNCCCVLGGSATGGQGKSSSAQSNNKQRGISLREYARTRRASNTDDLSPTEGSSLVPHTQKVAQDSRHAAQAINWKRFIAAEYCATSIPPGGTILRRGWPPPGEKTVREAPPACFRLTPRRAWVL